MLSYKRLTVGHDYILGVEIVMRVVKKPEIRKAEILDAARTLFMTEGYENTSIEKIIGVLKIAKGTFYYYFKSKEELLDTLVDDMTNSIMTSIYACVENSELNAIEKFNKIFVLARNIKAENIELLLPLIKILYKSNNVMMRYKMFESNTKLVSPVFSKVINQGNIEGVFNVEFVDETANLIMVIGNSFSEKTAELLLADIDRDEKVERIERELEAYESIIARMLGVINGSISIVDKNIVSVFVKS